MRFGGRISKAIGFALILLFFSLGTWRLGRSFLADWHDRRGQAIEQGKRWTGAIEEYRQAVRLEGGRIEYRLRLADALARRGRYGLDREAWLVEAIGEYQKAIALDPRYSPCYLRLGITAERLAQARLSPALTSPLSPAHNPIDPLSCYLKAVSLDPHNAYYRAILADFYLRHGSIQAGLREYEEALACYPVLAHYPDMALRARSGDEGTFATIERGLRRAMANLPLDVRPYRELARLYATKGRHEEAQAVYRQGAERTGNLDMSRESQADQKKGR